jgi:hypothetical protein
MTSEETFAAEQGIKVQRNAKRTKEDDGATLKDLPADPGLTTKTLTLEVKRYIAHPYWPEVHWLFSLDKAALIHPKHSAAKKDQILQAHCKNEGIAWQDVLDARTKIATEQWYKDTDGNIIVPRHHLVCSWIQSLRNHPMKKQIKVEQFRTFCNCTDGIVTPAKKVCDGKFRRYCSSEESNLRRLQEHEEIRDFQVTTEVTFMANILTTKELTNLIKFAGVYFGMGAARKMDYGRYMVVSFA